MSRRDASILRSIQANSSRLSSVLPLLSGNPPASARPTDDNAQMSGLIPFSGHATKQAWDIQDSTVLNFPATKYSKQVDMTGRKKMPLADITPKNSTVFPKGLVDAVPNTWNNGDAAVKYSGFDQLRDIDSSLNKGPRFGRLEEILPSARSNAQPRELSLTEMVAQVQRKEVPLEEESPKASRSAHCTSQWPVFLKPLFPIRSEYAMQQSETHFPAIPLEKKSSQPKRSTTKAMKEKTVQHSPKKYDAFEINWNDL